MNSLIYTRYELLRTLRNRRFFLLSLGFPLILFFAIAGPNRHVRDLDGSGISFPLYYMVGMAAFGTMSAMFSCGGRIAAERAVGWNRQLRITPLSPRSYFRVKVITGYMMAIISLLALYLAGTSLGVRLSGSQWLNMTGLILVGLVPFAAFGILAGHMLTPDSTGPAMGGGISLLALLGGGLLPARPPRLPPRTGAVHPLLLARASQSRRGRGTRLAGKGMDRDDCLDGCAQRARRACLPA